jgi:hypothetical protein
MAIFDAFNSVVVLVAFGHHWLAGGSDRGPPPRQPAGFAAL